MFTTRGGRWAEQGLSLYANLFMSSPMPGA